MHARSVNEAVELLDRSVGQACPIQIRPEDMQLILAQ